MHTKLFLIAVAVVAAFGIAVAVVGPVALATPAVAAIAGRDNATVMAGNMTAMGGNMTGNMTSGNWSTTP